MVGPGGGTIALGGVGSFKFPAGAFPAATQVTIRTTADPATAALYTETTGIFELGPRASYEVRIDVGRVAPTQPLAVELTIPDDFDGAAHRAARRQRGTPCRSSRRSPPPPAAAASS